MAKEVLKTEIAAYEKAKPELMKRGLAGKWIVFVGEEQVVIHDDPEAAYAAGVAKVGTDKPFLMKQIGSPDEMSNPAYVLGLVDAVR